MKNWAVYALIVAGVFIYGAATEVDRDSSGAIVGEGDIDAFQIRVGDCFDDVSSDDEQVSSLPGLPCSEPHDNEVFAVFDVSIASYPGGESMSELANNSCLGHFDSFVGKDYQSSSLEISTLYPSVESWEQRDREVICAVYDMNLSKLVGSVQGRAL